MMIPVTQTKFHESDSGTKGNCFAACVASILELPIDKVIPFDEYEDDEGNAWSDVAFSFFYERNLDIDISIKPIAGYAIACGFSERNVLHSVVVYNGEIVHDPHPSKSGIAEIMYYLFIHELEENGR